MNTQPCVDNEEVIQEVVEVRLSTTTTTFTIIFKLLGERWSILFSLVLLWLPPSIKIIQFSYYCYLMIMLSISGAVTGPGIVWSRLSGVFLVKINGGSFCLI